MRRVVLPGVLLLVLLMTLSCATVPKSAVKLSDTIGTDLAALKASYLSLIEVNYDRMREDIEKFVWEVYAPGAIRAVILDDPAEDYEGALTDIKNALGSNEETEVIQIMKGATKAIISDIEGFQRELEKPIDEQEKAFVLQVENAFNNLIQANATITAHLSSVVKVQEAQDDLLGSVGLGDLKQQIEDVALKADKGLDELYTKHAELLKKKADAEQTLDGLKAKLNELLDKK